MKAFCKVIGKVRSEAGLLESRTEIQGIVGIGGQKIFLCGQSVDKTKRKGVSVNANPLFLLVEAAGLEPASEKPTLKALHA